MLYFLAENVCQITETIEEIADVSKVSFEAF